MKQKNPVFPQQLFFAIGMTVLAVVGHFVFNHELMYVTPVCIEWAALIATNCSTKNPDRSILQFYKNAAKIGLFIFGITIVYAFAVYYRNNWSAPAGDIGASLGTTLAHATFYLIEKRKLKKAR